MYTDIVDLRSFYLTPLGLEVRRLLRHRLLQLWPDVRGLSVLALGYATPLLRPYVDQAQSIMALMPAMQGVVFWPKEGPNRTALADLFDLPLADNSVDRVIMLHAMEATENTNALLREAWRVLRSGGRMIAVVPNRRSLWAMSDATPFGAGQPFSHSQIKSILRENNFLPERSARALYAPPWQGRLWRKLGPFCETWGAAIFPNANGALLVEASKQLYAPIYAARARSQKGLRMPVPALVQPDGPVAVPRRSDHSGPAR